MVSRADVFSVLLLITVSILLSEAAIYKRPSNNERVFSSVPIQEVHHQLNRLRRAASGGNGKEPIFQKTLLNDTSNTGLVQYAGNDSKVIYVLTHLISPDNSIISSNVYRSSDYGYTFTNISSKVGNGAVLGQNIFTSPQDSQRVYFTDATESAIYISIDEGVTFTKRSFSPNNIRMSTLVVHPMFEDWVLARDSDNNLYESKTFGRTAFNKIAENVVFCQWGEYPFDQDHSLVYFGVFTDNEDEYRLYTQHLPYDDSSMSQFDSNLGVIDGFLMVDRYIFAQKTIDGVVSLWVSADRKPFKQAKIPSNDGHLNYLVDSVRSIQALVVVQHVNNVFNLYMSEEHGELYYLALDDIKLDIYGPNSIAIDLEVIESMNYTTYIANQYIRYTDVDAEPLLRTLISFDVGANWELLTPPTTVDKECLQPDCSLHLHMSTSEYWRTGVYSQESAPGIIIAHGVTGQSLNDDNTNLFISRDGGSTWSQTLDGTWGVSVVDLGGLIVAARDYHAGANESRTLKYTCDEGMTWSDLTFTNNNLRVFAVISEPGEATTVVSLYGVEVDVLSWAVITIDFKNIFPRDCESTDYYGWTPFDDSTETGCLLGASVTVERHQPSVCCRNGQDYNREISYETCQCSEEDFECDYGYKHANGYSGACVRDTEVTLDTPCSSDKDLTYIQTQGYHKIGGDVCSGGDESVYSSVEMSCCYINSDSSTGSGTTTSIVLAVFVILALMVIGVFAVIMTVWIVKYFRSRGRGGRAAGYRVAPTYDPSSPEDTPTSVGVQNINYDDDDSDARPLSP